MYVKVQKHWWFYSLSTVFFSICSNASVIFNGLSLTERLFIASSKLVGFTFFESFLCFRWESLTVNPRTSPRSPRSLLYLLIRFFYYVLLNGILHFFIFWILLVNWNYAVAFFFKKLSMRWHWQKKTINITIFLTNNFPKDCTKMSDKNVFICCKKST